jgi:hypothetical protein
MKMAIGLLLLASVRTQMAIQCYLCLLLASNLKMRMRLVEQLGILQAEATA